MTDINVFAKAAVSAVNEFLLKMSDEERKTVSGLVDVGNALSVALVIQPDGASTVLVEVVGADGKRHPVGHLQGDFYTVQ